MESFFYIQNKNCPLEAIMIVSLILAAFWLPIWNTDDFEAWVSAPFKLASVKLKILTSKIKYMIFTPNYLMSKILGHHWLHRNSLIKANTNDGWFQKE